MAMTFDQFVEKRIGRIGIWQAAMMLTLIMTSCPTLQFFTNFAFITPHHHCRQPELENLSWTRPEILNLSIPVKANVKAAPMPGQTFHPCLEYDLDGLLPLITYNTTLEEALILRDHLPNLTTRSCRNGVSFNANSTMVPGSFGEEFNIVCARRYFIPLSNVIYIVGMLIGLVMPGPLSDRFGRRPVCLLMPFGALVSGLVTSLIPNLWMFLVLRFISAICSTTSFLTSVILICEWIDAGQRNGFNFFRKLYYGPCSRGFFVLCFFIMPSWRSAYAFYFLLMTPLITGYFLWKESPRWLLSYKKIEEAHASILKILRWNRRPLYPQDAVDIKSELVAISSTMQSRIDSGQSNFFKNVGYIFRNSKFRRPIILMLIIWPMQAFMYYGLNFNAIRLGGNPYLMAIFAALTSVPGNFLQYLLYRFFDRKWPLVALYSLSSISLLIAFILLLVDIDGPALVAVCTLGLMFSDALFTMIYIRTPELFPTSVRSTSIGICSGFARIGMLLAAYVERLDEIAWKPLPMLIFFAASFIATIASVFLPAGKGEMREWHQEKSDSEDEMEESEEDEMEDFSLYPNIQMRNVHSPLTART